MRQAVKKICFRIFAHLAIATSTLTHRHSERISLFWPQPYHESNLFMHWVSAVGKNAKKCVALTSNEKSVVPHISFFRFAFDSNTNGRFAGPSIVYTPWRTASQVWNRCQATNSTM